MRGYRFAIQWLADNDDCGWLEDDEFIGLSVSASLVADIYEKSDEKVMSDLRKFIEKRKSH